MSDLCAWVDASAGVAGDMLLGALIDAGARLDVVQAAVDAVLPDAMRLTTRPVDRAALRATKLAVEVLVPDPPHRTWRDIRRMLEGAPLAGAIRDSALAVFSRLAAAEAQVHGVEVDDIHFHEVGALDAIADIVGSCAALHHLGITRLMAGPVAVGSGHVNAAHGRMPVPVPAVVQLAAGWQISGGGAGELTTPTGMALLVALAQQEPTLPPMTLHASGMGAGDANPSDHANVTCVLIGEPPAEAFPPVQVVCLEANVDDQDPRLWPDVLSRLLDSGADDAWLVPILMKKGRPAHTLTVLCRPEFADALSGRVLELTTTIGVRRSVREKLALARTWFHLPVGGRAVAVKVASGPGGVISHVVPEYDDAVAAASGLGIPVRQVLAKTIAAAEKSGLCSGVRLDDVILDARDAPVTRPR